MKNLTILYSPQHQLHAPRTEYLHGRVLPYAEVPQRIEIIRERLAHSDHITLREPEVTIPRAALTAVLDDGMLRYIESTSQNIGGLLTHESAMYTTTDEAGYVYPSTFPIRASMSRFKDHPHAPHGHYFFDCEAPIGRDTWSAVLASANLAYQGAQMLHDERLVYALCRPPGHHAGADFMGGYCYLNNAAIGAAALRTHGKVALIDVDYHHGNGTQSIFWDDPQVFFASLHAHPDFEYPYYSGYADEIADGTNLNIPLPAGTDDAVYLAALDSVVERVRDFAPAALVISLGFDIFAGDPMGTFAVSADGLTSVAQRLAALDLPTLIIQEGGYAVAESGMLAEKFIAGIANIQF